MKNLVAQVVAISLLGAGSAIAADMRAPVKAPPPAAPIAASWTGCYLGAGFGYGMWNQDHTEYTLAGVAQSFEATSGGRGWLGTVQVGCDVQIGGQFVIGAFADYDWANIKGDAHLSLGTFPYVGEEKLKSGWAAGGRIGYIPFAQTQLMVFVSGGYTRAKFSSYDLTVNLGGAQAAAFRVDSSTRSGWFIGTGYEYALAFFPGLTWKTEYRFADYGKERDTVFAIAGGAPVAFTDSEKFVHTVRSELVWRFNFGGLRGY